MSTTSVKIHCEPGYDCRSFMTGDWLDENGHHVMHELTYWQKFFPHKPGNEGVNMILAIRHLQQEPRTSYWLSDVLYTNKRLAEAEALQHGFIAQEGFYCEEPNLHWFPIFHDFDKALEFLKTKTGISYISE